MRAILLSLALVSTPAQAEDLRIPAGTMLCRTLEAAANPAHAGCWIARGGQRVEIIATLPHFVQMRVWSSDGAESMTAWASREAADRIQTQEASR